MRRHLLVRPVVVVGALSLACLAGPASAALAGPAVQAGKPAGKAAPAVQPVQKPPAAKPGAGQAGGAPEDSYSYRAEGRRDPFVSLLNRGMDPRQRKAEGVTGLLAGDVVLRGVLQNRGTYLAIVQGPDGKRQYIVHPNDRFADGVVKAITADSMLILQEVNDPLSLTKQREIRKTLRAVEEVK